MKSLFCKYISDDITVDELDELKKVLDMADGDCVSSELEDLWKSTSKSKYQKKSKHTLRTASAFFVLTLMILFAITSIKYKSEVQSLMAQEVKFETRKGESASISLPDGTKVKLNHSSVLAYNPGLYNSDERVISFEGDAYFDVEKNPDRPFVINSEGLVVKVLGTSFGLRTYRDMDYVLLVLDDGQVSFKSLLSNEELTINPNEMLKMEINSGKCQIFGADEEWHRDTWGKECLQFKNQKLRFIIQSLENNYGVKIVLAEPSLGDDLFTGTLPSDDILEVIDILEYSYMMDARIERDTITFFR